ncbi:hypothetical protein ARMSODRAFT_560672 [Armillaria solidipes]|uniref:Uncharacterized protein n=1 Tax=Armillaria solidipes TaxID=1076256 RepID=A0A2H3AVN3_9AGAR|nr:hypothetical protein ARMSODRAFT_560672 [Armillaria solidipes]
MTFSRIASSTQLFRKANIPGMLLLPEVGIIRGNIESGGGETIGTLIAYRRSSSPSQQHTQGTGIPPKTTQHKSRVPYPLLVEFQSRARYTFVSMRMIWRG